MIYQTQVNIIRLHSLLLQLPTQGLQDSYFAGRILAGADLDGPALFT
jgi:hypothetical protein